MSHPSPAIVQEPAAPHRALPSTLVVRVTEEDGLLGIRRNPHWCRFARAIRRALVLMGYRPDDVTVGGYVRGYSTVVIKLFGQRPQIFELGGRDAPQILAYDNGERVEPCTVTLVAS